MPELKETLARFLTIPGVRAALLVGRDGLTIEGVGQGNEAIFECLSAMSSSGLNAAEALGRELARGQLIGTLMEYEGGLVSIDPLGDFAMVVTLADSPASLGLVRYTIKRSRAALIEALDMA
jgi:predicted regulator of Ras-like GTPase activity (Roadblock/LC7/MglB family)